LSFCVQDASRGFAGRVLCRRIKVFERVFALCVFCRLWREARERFIPKHLKRLTIVHCGGVRMVKPCCVLKCFNAASPPCWRFSWSGGGEKDNMPEFGTTGILRNVSAIITGRQWRPAALVAKPFAWFAPKKALMKASVSV